ncbi:SGNH/GDSL hydrolase family protein [Chryseobacterium taichungense]|uniref:SGNH/GDSL hydrolase family protein n=1 Tax=Chryseobacterium taichungense TaxID=295069 RepID=UPI0028AF0632|nr:SGNH/GDSL hydrolase family protein [Chryseobacterium taichungense]
MHKYILFFSILLLTSCSKKYDIAILGDSISTEDGRSNILHDSTYVGLLETKYSVYVDAVAGSSIISGGQSDTVDFTNDSRIKNITSSNSKIILVFGGINDFLQDLPLGKVGDISKTASFYGALDYLYKNLKKNNPNSKIYHLTPLHTLFIQSGGLSPEFNGKNYLADYKKAIFVMSKKYNIQVIDGDKTGITTSNINNLSDDGLHIKEKGHKLIFDLIMNEIKFQKNT